MPAFNPYIIVLLISSIITFGLATVFWQRRHEGRWVWPSIVLTLAVAVWTFGNAFELWASDLASKLFWAKVQYLGIVTTSPAWLAFAMQRVGWIKWVTTRRAILLSAIPIITLVLVVTNEFHHLVWSSTAIDATGSFLALDTSHGVWFWVNAGYGFLLQFVGVIALIVTYARSSETYRRQNLALLVGLSLPLVAAIARIFRLVPPTYVDFTPLAATVSVLLLAALTLHLRLFDITPIARQMIVDNMSNGVLVLDQQNRIVDINPIAQTILGAAAADVVGQPVHQFMLNRPQLAPVFADGAESNAGIGIEIDGWPRYYDWHVSVLRNRRGQANGRLITFDDVTERKQIETEVRLLLSLTQDVSTAPDFAAALHAALRLIVEHTGWIFGEAWLPSADGRVLEHCKGSYYRGKRVDKLQRFERASREFSFGHNAGFPGRIWASGQSEWQQDISALSIQVYHRAQHAAEAGLKATLGVPVLTGDQVVAVMVFYMDAPRAQDQRLVNLVTAVAAQLGTVMQHKQAEETMRLQAAAMNATANGIVITDHAGAITWVNPAFTALTGYTSAEALGQNPRLFKSGQNPPKLYQQMWDTVLSGQTWHGEIINKRKDGSIYTEEQIITPVHNDAGKITHFVAIKHDITKRKTVEKALETERNLLRTLIDNIPDLIYTKDIHGKFSLANIALAQLTGQSGPDDLIGQDEFDTASPEIAAQFMAVEQEIRRTGKPSLNHIEKTIDSQGNLIWLSTTKVPLKNNAGEIIGIVGISRDISEQRQAEEELRILSRAVEQSGSSIVITDLDGSIEFVNPAFTCITGYTLEEAIGENTRVLKSGEHSSEFYRELWETIKRGDVWQGEMLNCKKDGSQYWETATISPVIDTDGNTTHYLAIKEDITARKEIEAALAQEQQKTDALLCNILPAEIATELKTTGRVAPKLFDCTSIMFTDFGHFTESAEQADPQTLIDDLDHYFSAFDAIIAKHGLEKLKTIGDGYMCAGGLPTPSKTHAADTVRAALEILDFVDTERESRQQAGRPYWELRIGISSGPVIAGVVGQQKYAYDVWGDTVVMASRMETSGEIGYINISQATYEEVKDQFECEYRGKVQAKHKGEVDMYFVVRA